MSLDHLEWRYLHGGEATHALSYSAAAIGRCGIGPDPLGAHPDWYGTGNQAEYERAAQLPRCRRCLQLLGATS